MERRRHEYRSSRTTTTPRALFLLPSIVLFGIQVHAETSRQIARRSGGDGGYHSPPAGLRSLNREEEEEEEDDDDAPPSYSSSSRNSARNNNNRVDFLYTYGSPSVVAGPHVSNPGNRCGELFFFGITERWCSPSSPRYFRASVFLERSSHHFISRWNAPYPPPPDNKTRSAWNTRTSSYSSSHHCHTLPTRLLGVGWQSTVPPPPWRGIDPRQERSSLLLASSLLTSSSSSSLSPCCPCRFGRRTVT